MLNIKENKEFITARFRNICGFSLSSSYDDVQKFLTSKGIVFPSNKGDLNTCSVINLDPLNCTIPQDPFNIKDSEALNLTGFSHEDGDKIYLGKYLEPRLIYTRKLL